MDGDLTGEKGDKGGAETAPGRALQENHSAVCVWGGGFGEDSRKGGHLSVGWDVLKPMSASELRPDWQDDLEQPLRILNPAWQGCSEGENNPGESAPSITNVSVSSNSVCFKETYVLLP